MSIPSCDWATDKESRLKLCVLVYHGAIPDRFGRQLNYLAGGYTFVSGAEDLAVQRCDTQLPDLALWVTFDDGQRSVVEHGLPEPERIGAVATMFVRTDLIPFARLLVVGRQRSSLTAVDQV